VRSRLPGVYLAVGKLAEIFVDISLVQKFVSLIFLIGFSNFRLTQRIVAEISLNLRADTAKINRKFGDICRIFHTQSLPKLNLFHAVYAA